MRVLLQIVMTLETRHLLYMSRPIAYHTCFHSLQLTLSTILMKASICLGRMLLSIFLEEYILNKICNPILKARVVPYRSTIFPASFILVGWEHKATHPTPRLILIYFGSFLINPTELSDDYRQRHLATNQKKFYEEMVDEFLPTIYLFHASSVFNMT
jgi:hypothetical protein